MLRLLVTFYSFTKVKYWIYFRIIELTSIHVHILLDDTWVFFLVLCIGSQSDVMVGQPTEHNEALSAALELFVTQELNNAIF